MNRPDRINFPIWKDEEVWGSGSPSGITQFYNIASPDPRLRKFRQPDDLEELQIEDSVVSVPIESAEFFRDRERRGLVTPARTPSDILKRGPLYVSSDFSDSQLQSPHDFRRSDGTTVLRSRDQRESEFSKIILDMRATVTKLSETRVRMEKLVSTCMAAYYEGNLD